MLRWGGKYRKPTETMYGNWSRIISLSSIARKTDNPKYQDADESDVFILSGAGRSVPVLSAAGCNALSPLVADGLR